MHYVSTNIPVKVHIVQVGDMSFSIIGRCLFKTTQEVTDINAVKTHAHGSRCQIQHFCHILHPIKCNVKITPFPRNIFYLKVWTTGTVILFGSYTWFLLWVYPQTYSVLSSGFQVSKWMKLRDCTKYNCIKPMVYQSCLQAFR